MKEENPIQVETKQEMEVENETIPKEEKQTEHTKYQSNKCFLKC